MPSRKITAMLAAIYQTLETPNPPSPLSWTQCGRGFKITNPSQLLTHPILQRRFHLTNIHAFIRQLLLSLGCHKKQQDGCVWYYHSMLVRGKGRRLGVIEGGLRGQEGKGDNGNSSMVEEGSREGDQEYRQTQQKEIRLLKDEQSINAKNRSLLNFNSPQSNPSDNKQSLNGSFLTPIPFTTQQVAISIIKPLVSTISRVNDDPTNRNSFIVANHSSVSLGNTKTQQDLINRGGQCLGGNITNNGQIDIRDNNNQTNNQTNNTAMFGTNVTSLCHTGSIQELKLIHRTQDNIAMRNGAANYGSKLVDGVNNNNNNQTNNNNNQINKPTPTPQLLLSLTHSLLFQQFSNLRQIVQDILVADSQTTRNFIQVVRAYLDAGVQLFGGLERGILGKQ